MTISSATRKAGPYTGNGVATSFAFSFKIFTDGDLQVVLLADGVESELVLNSDYSVTLNADQNASPGGSITYPISGDPLAADETLTIGGDISALQPAALSSTGGFYPRVIEDALDRAVILIQQLVERTTRAIRAPLSDSAALDMELPPASERAGTLVGFDAVGLLTTYAVQIGTSIVDLAASFGSSLVGFIQSGTGSVATSTQTKLRECKSLQDWMTAELKACVISGTYSAQNRTDMLAALTAAWTSALANNHDLSAPAGIYEIGAANFPWRQDGTPVSLLDCGNVTLYCEGQGTVFKTVSVNGADVFQLNGLKNFHVKGFPTLTASISGTGAGSNGVSVTNGFDNLTLEVAALNLPSLDKTIYVDGGKALTVQPDTTVNECGSLVATVFATGCAEGFGCDMDPDTMDDKRASIKVDLVAQDCYIAAKYSASAASAALAAGATSGIVVRGQAINCQRDVQLARVRGIDVEMQVITTKTAAARRLDSNGTAWLAADTVVDALSCTYAHNARVVVTGNKGACDYKVQIGAAADGLSTLTEATYASSFYLDIGGTAATADFNQITVSAVNLSNCAIYATPTTLSSYPAACYTEASNNMLAIGPTQRLVNPLISGALKFTDANVADAYSQIAIDGYGLWVKQTGSSATGNHDFGVKAHDGAKLFAVRNDGFLVSDGRVAASAVATVLGAMPIYNTANTLVGYVPIYTGYTP